MLEKKGSSVLQDSHMGEDTKNSDDQNSDEGSMMMSDHEAAAANHNNQINHTEQDKAAEERRLSTAGTGAVAGNVRRNSVAFNVAGVGGGQGSSGNGGEMPNSPEKKFVLFKHTLSNVKDSDNLDPFSLKIENALHFIDDALGDNLAQYDNFLSVGDDPSEIEIHFNLEEHRQNAKNKSYLKNLQREAELGKPYLNIIPIYSQKEEASSRV